MKWKTTIQLLFKVVLRPVFLFFIFLMFFQDAYADIRYVDSAATGGNTGVSWTDAYNYLSDALSEAQADTTIDTILVAKGTYYPTGVQSGTNRDSSFSLFRGGLKLYGGFPTGGGTFSQRILPSFGGTGGGTILSGNIGASGDSTDNSRHVVIIVGIDAGSDSLILDGFRIQEGVATGAGSTYPKGEALTNSKGAGIYTSRIDTTAVVILNHFLIINNHASSHGGGLVANNSFFYLLNSSIAHNQSGDLGGGLYDAGGSQLMIRHCNFLANRAINGGGIYNNTGSSPVLEDCAILLNTAGTATGNGGGGIYNADNASPFVIGCVIAGNSGNTGGGWYNDSTATAKLYNVLLSGNSAIHVGAAWYSEANDSVWLVNATIAGNHVNFPGGGSVFLGGSFNNIILQNSIVWNNTSTVVGGLTLANSIVQSGANGGWDWDPQFLVPIDDPLSPDTLGNYRLSTCSPALNAGDSAFLPSWLTVDLDGQQRIVGANVDLGAYELSMNPYAQHVLYVDSSITVSGDGSSWSSAMQTLSEAFQKAADCSSVDSILVAKGTYYPTGSQTDTEREASFVITRGLKVYGGYAPAGASRDISAYPSILSGDIGVAGDTTDNSFHVMILPGIDSTADSVVVDGLSIVNGIANGSGSTMMNSKSVSRNKGGGLYINSVTDSMVVLRNCKLLNNYASAGGGGLYISTSGVIFNRIIFAGNRTETAGGGIYSYHSNPVLINCLVSGNKTYSGSSARVGGVQNSNNGKVVLINTTVSGNDYGGLRNTSTATFELQNCLVYGNAGFGIDGDTSMIFHSLVEGLNTSANGNLPGTIDPLFVAPESAAVAPSSLGDYHVFPCSPIIDMGDNAVLPPGDSLDLDRNERVKNTTVDLGAYEHQGMPGLLSDTSVQVLCHGDSISFRGAYYSNSGYFTDTVAQVTGCDSLYVLDLVVLPSTDTLPAQTYDSCSQVAFGGQIFLSDTLLNRVFSYVATSCDSAYQEVYIYVFHPDTVFLNEEICFGDTLFVGSQAFAASGQYQVVLSNSSGCDSVIHLNLLVSPVKDTLITAKICFGDSYLFDGQNLSTSGTYTDTIAGGSVSGCDSIVTLTLTVNPVYEDTIAASICPGGSYTFGDSTYMQSGIYTHTFSTVHGCDSMVTLELNVNSYATGTVTAEICSGNSYLFDGQSLSTSGTYTDTIAGGSVSGCDSIVTLTLTVNPVYDDTIAANICPGNGYAFGDSTYTQAGNYTHTFSTVHGCDSMVTLELNVNSYATGTITAEICSGDSYLFDGQSLSTSGTYTDTIAGGSVSGCDSIVTLTLTVNPVYEDTIAASICPGNGYAFGDSTYTQAGNYTHTFSTVHGCDSMVTLELNVNSYATGTITAEICSDDSYLFGGQSLSTSGTYTDTIVGGSVSGCDSIVTLTLTVNPVYEDTIAASICPGGSYTFGDSTYTQGGNYTQTFPTVQDCDSTVTLELNVNSYASGTVSAEICSGDSYLFDGQNLSTSGTYTDTIVGGSVSGCDSIVTLTLTVNPVYEDTIAASICPGGSYALGMNTYTTAGFYTDTFETIQGCDSTVTLELNVNSYATGTVLAEICSGNSYLFDGQSLSTSGTYTDTIVGGSISGCDSIVTLTLTVTQPPVTLLDTIINCDSIQFKGITYWSSTDVSDTLLNDFGCDSVYLYTHLVVFSSDTTQLPMSICQGDTAFVGMQGFTATGTHWVVLNSQHGCDSVIELELTVHSVYEVFDTVQTCPSGLPFSFGGQLLNSSGNYTGSFSTIFGCDSIVHLSLNVIPAYQTFDTVTVCFADLPYIFDGQQLFQPGNYTDTFTSFSGCDSILYLNLKVMPAAQNLSIDTGGCGQVSFEGNIYHQSTTLQDTLYNYLGCDSVYRSIHVVVWNNTPVETTIDSLGCELVYFKGRNYYSDTLISEYFHDIHGCDSFIRHTQIHILKGVRDTLQVSICRGDSYEFGGQQRTQSGVYTASYPYWNGCDSIAVLELTVHELPEVKIETDPKPTGYCIGDEILLAGRGALHYRWWTDFGKEYGHRDSAIVVLMKENNVFFLEGKDEWSCVDTAMIELDAGHCCQLFIPNAFTPNGDGRNDKFGVETNGHPKTFRMEIYNRLGQRIYIGYRVGDHWDGLVKGQPAAMGTYYYRVSGICTDDKPFNEKGSFTLIR